MWGLYTGFVWMYAGYVRRWECVGSVEGSECVRYAETMYRGV